MALLSILFCMLFEIFLSLLCNGDVAVCLKIDVHVYVCKWLSHVYMLYHNIGSS